MKHERIAITGCHLVKVGPGTIDVDVANTESVLNLVNKTSIFQLVTASMMNHHSLFHGRLSGLCSACNRIGFSGGRCSFDSHRRGRLWVTQIIGTKFLGYILQEWTKQYWITRVVVAHLSTKSNQLVKKLVIRFNSYLEIEWLGLRRQDGSQEQVRRSIGRP